MSTPVAIYLRASDIQAALRTFYAKNGYVVLSEVRNGTGFQRSVRTADMLVVSTWPSRGLFAVGIEIKCNRGDLIRELANPLKADEIARYCQEWYIAVPTGLITPAMLIPETWGVIEVGAKLDAKIVRPSKMPAESVHQMDTLFCCSVIRAFSEQYVAQVDIAVQIAAAIEAERKRIEASKIQHKSAAEDAVAAVKESSGIDLLTEYGRARWECGAIAKAVGMIAEMRRHPVEELREACELMDRSSIAVKAVLEVIGKTEGVTA